MPGLYFTLQMWTLNKVSKYFFGVRDISLHEKNITSDLPESESTFSAEGMSEVGENDFSDLIF